MGYSFQLVIRSIQFLNDHMQILCFWSSWWSMVKHLTWSLLGIAELDPLDSVDSTSATLARLLFGAFLIMGVILLVNMMIALLSNTYQRVEVTLTAFVWSIDNTLVAKALVNHSAKLDLTWPNITLFKRSLRQPQNANKMCLHEAGRA